MPAPHHAPTPARPHARPTRDEALLLTSSAVSGMGDSIAALAFTVLAYRMTGSTAWTAGVAAAQVVPRVLLGLLGGALMGHLPTRCVMVRVDLARSAVEAVFAVLVLTGHATLPALLVTTVVLQAGGCLFTPGSRALVVAVAGPSRRVRLNAWLSTAGNLTDVAAPLLAGCLLDHGPALAFGIDAGSFAAGAVLLRLMSPAADPPRTSTGGVARAVRAIPGDIARFVGEAARHRVVGPVFATTFVCVLAATWPARLGVLAIMVPTPGASLGPYTAVMAAGAGVAILVTALVPVLRSRLDLRDYAIGATGWGVGLALVAVLAPAGSVGVLVGVAVAAAATAWLSQARVALLQEHLPAERVPLGFATNATLLYLANAISYAVYGAATARFTAAALVMVGAVVLVAAGLVAVRNVQELR